MFDILEVVMATIRTVAAVSAALLSVVALFYKPIIVRIEVLGLTRPLDKIHNIHGQDLRTLPNTLHCEDLHYHEHSHLLFGASQENPDARWLWFPPYVEPHILVLIFSACFFRSYWLILCASIAKFDDPHALDRGTIITVDPEVR